MSQPTKQTLDAEEHKKDLEEQRKKKPLDQEDKTTVQDKEHSPEGSKMDGSLDKKDYPFDEADDQFEKRQHKKAPSVADEVNSDCPCNK